MVVIHGVVGKVLPREVSPDDKRYVEIWMDECAFPMYSEIRIASDELQLDDRVILEIDVVHYKRRPAQGAA